MNLSRRGFISGLAAVAGAAVAAPAIVRVESLMVLPQAPKLLLPKNSLLTVNMITREAIQLFRNSNVFLRAVDAQYDEQFAVEGARIGTSLRIRMPKDFTLLDGPPLLLEARGATHSTV